MSNRKHILDIESLSLGEIKSILKNALVLLDVSKRAIKKTPALRGKTIINLFLEPSTRTRASFEIAGKRLSADTININGSSSSVVKGETLLDTARNLQAMSPDVLVVRHKEAGAAKFLSRYLNECSIINAGDGSHEHPTQALLDALVLMDYFGSDQFSGKTVAIIGDILHSRVARSWIWLHLKFGNKIKLIGPPTLLPKEFLKSFPGEDIDIDYRLEGIKDADIILTLRMQLERESGRGLPSLYEYSRLYCLTLDRFLSLAPKGIVLHPGPANRGIEISSDLLDSQYTLFSKQVEYGVALRMASLLYVCIGRDYIEKKQESYQSRIEESYNLIQKTEPNSEEDSLEISRSKIC